MPLNPFVCPVCGAHTEDNHLNVSAIKSATAWTRINLSDEQISGLARGVLVLSTVPAPYPDGEVAVVDPDCDEVAGFMSQLVVEVLREPSSFQAFAKIEAEFLTEHMAECERCQRYQAQKRTVQ